MPTHLRDETESTRAIASFCDLDERVVRRRGQHARSGIVVKIGGAWVAKRDYGQRARVGLRIADGEDVVYLVRADERIDLGHLRLQFVAITLDETPGDNQSLRVTLGLQTRCFEDRIDRFLFGGIDKAARV